MRHKKETKILKRGTSHRRSLVKNLMRSFFIYEKIKTTISKAKFIRPEIEKIITVGKNNNLYSRRLIMNKLGTYSITKKIINDIAPRFKERKGGYTRIIKIGRRQGDNATMVFITLV